MMTVMEDHEVWQLKLGLLPPQSSRKSGQRRKKKGLHLKLERFLCMNSTEDQKEKGLQSINQSIAFTVCCLNNRNNNTQYVTECRLVFMLQFIFESIPEQKSVSKVLKTWYFLYSTWQWGTAVATPGFTTA